jgi:hypothetical protein
VDQQDGNQTDEIAQRDDQGAYYRPAQPEAEWAGFKDGFHGLFFIVV